MFIFHEDIYFRHFKQFQLQMTKNSNKLQFNRVMIHTEGSRALTL